jgi:hypothetical protein
MDRLQGSTMSRHSVGTAIDTLICVGLLSLALAGCAAPQRGMADARGPIERAQAARLAALVARDFAALDRLLGADLTYCHSNGACETKQSFIASLRENRLRYDEFEVIGTEVRGLGEIALANGRVKAKGQFNGQAIDATLVHTSAYAWRDGAWQLVAWQSTRLP